MMMEYLKEPNVPTIGGSWIVEEELVDVVVSFVGDSE